MPGLDTSANGTLNLLHGLERALAHGRARIIPSFHERRIPATTTSSRRPPGRSPSRFPRPSSHAAERPSGAAVRGRRERILPREAIPSMDSQETPVTAPVADPSAETLELTTLKGKTMAELLKENKRLEVDLKGLKT